MFSFILPILSQQMDASAKVMPVSGAQRVLLLVKDINGGNTLQTDLIRRGYETELCHVKEGTAWLAALLLAAPDAVVLDLGLTSERGWEILKVMKENPSSKDIPVLFYTIAGDDDHGSLLEIDYLTKPVETGAIAEMFISKGIINRGSNAEVVRSILVVDDEPGILDMHVRIVSAQLPDYRVLQAKDGREALRIIGQERPALVLLDLMMPEMDGFAVLEEMRKSDLTRNTPVVVITGQALTEEDMARLNSGAASILGKGMFSIEETLEHLAAALAHKHRPGSETQRIALKVMAYIHANYAEPISRRLLAAHVGLSERHLTRCFHQEVGMTPITYLNRYRVKQARAFLDTGEKGITKIAVEVGFASSSYFTRVFREEVGVSPRAYLQSLCK